MKKVLLLIAVFSVVFHGSFSQIRVEYSGDRKLLAEGGVHPTKIDYPSIQLPEFDFTELQEKSKKWEPNVPFQFGKAFNMNLSWSDGKWYDSPNGKIWKLGISSKGSHSINLIFSKLHLAKGASMYIYNDERDMLMGPFTNNNTNSAVGEFITDLVKGSSITIELFEPSSEFTDMSTLFLLVLANRHHAI